MKHILIGILFCGLAFSEIARSSEPAAFSEMTLEELKAVDKKALDKTERRLHKKALKEAKRAEKKRIKAEKKARKERIKANKKRLQHLESRLSHMGYSYVNSKVHSDDFKPTIYVKGAELYVVPNDGRFLSLQTSHRDDFFLRAFLSKDLQELTFQIYLRRKFREIPPEEYKADPSFSPSKFATEYGLWGNFTSAFIKGGKELELQYFKRGFEELCIPHCNFFEPVAVTIELDEMLEAINSEGVFLVKFYMENDYPVVANLTIDYVMGFLMRIAKLDKTRFQSFVELTATHYEELAAEIALVSEEP